METNELERELTTKIKVPKGIKEAVYNKLFKNLCMAILVLLYFIFVYLGYIKLKAPVFEEDLHVFAGILIILTIVSFEMSYRKSNREIGIHGIELLFLSIVTLFMPYIYFHRGNILKFTYSFVSIYVAVYYLIKCLVIYIIEIKKYRDGLSDIKEIIEDEDDETYLDKPNERKFKDKDDKENSSHKIVEPKVEKVEKKKSATNKGEKATEAKSKTKTTAKKSDTKKTTTKKTTTTKDTTKKADTKKTTTKKTTTKKADTTKDTTKKTDTKKVATKKTTTKKTTTKKKSDKADVKES